MKNSARGAAVEALLSVKENEGYSNIVIDKVLREYKLESRDKRLASAIFYGTLERQITIDFYLSFALKDGAKKLDSTIEVILRSAVYQIFFMDKIPFSAAVNAAVELTKEYGKKYFSGFVNAVLRTILRKKDTLILPSDNSENSLSIRYSVPAELIAMWKTAYGDEITFKILNSLSESPKTFVRINNIKSSVNKISESFKKNDVNFSEAILKNALVIDGIGSLADSEEFQNGLFHVQGIASQIACEIISPKSGEKVLDCCSAPGGKAFTMAEIMGNDGEIVACDLYKGRVNLIKKGAERLGLSIIKAIKRDATEKWNDDEKFDRILCDVPCSGYGVIRKKPEIRYKKLSTVTGLPDIQYQILQNSSYSLKNGGYLIYSTCTLNPAENGQVVEKFLNENKDFEPVAITLPSGVTRAVNEPDFMATLMPFCGSDDGFFIAVMKRK